MADLEQQLRASVTYIVERKRQMARRFWSKVNKTEGCWEWTGALRNGYGHFHTTGKSGTAYAHRLSFEMAYGPIDRGLFVCHKCDNRKCVRPDHLFLGTDEENLHDAGRKGRLAQKLTADIVRSILRDREAGATVPQLARRYGVCNATAYNVVARKSWRHLP